MLTQERLKELLHYEPETGIFVWKTRVTSRVPAGSIAGSLRNDGYLKINIKNKEYLSHRLAWFYMTGRWPSNEIDHINGIRGENNFENLREATHSENQQNISTPRPQNRSGILGAHLLPSGRYKSSIRINKKIIRLGTFDTAFEAHNAYINAKRELHSFNTL